MTDGFGGLRAFVQAAETLSFVEAGRRLGLSASAIGKSIARLEEQFDVRLFHRTTRSVSLTEDGARFLSRCTRILAEVEAMSLDFSRTDAALRGHLRVALPTAITFFTAHLAEFSRLHPQIELDVEFDDRLVNLVEDRFDVAIRTGEPEDSQFPSRRLASFRHVIVGAPSYLSSRPPLTNPAALNEHRLLLYKKPRTGKIEAWPVERELSPKRIGPAGGAVANSIDALIIMAREGRGLACVPDYFIPQELRDGMLSVVLESAASRDNSFHIFWPSKAQRMPRVRTFIDFMSRRMPRER
ncbi:LysR family transcriptional regulator [Myxococcus hansupus]|uniref:LysR family transcriptional regulator n=1 Tax=Pseudomyxococcus hansupus TaxID=1297742 RepID=UPI001D056B06|nr:LysR family transcriptional regulator [Myxococcus hansupus]